MLSLMLFSLLPSPAQALTERGDVIKWCTGGSIAGSGRCAGFLLAVEDALAVGTVEGVRACIPRDVTIQALFRSMAGYFDAEPEAQAETGLGLVAQAYARTWPCKE